MDEFIEKLIGRFEKESRIKYDQLDDGYCFDAEHFIYTSDAIRIAKELAEEYNGGWIPCDKELPKENGYYLITIKYYHLHNNVTMGCFFDDGEWYKIDKDDKVIAWQPLPKPYNPKGE